MISLLVVNFRSAALAIDAIRTARDATSSPLQVVVVDNSCDPREAEALRGHADALLVSATNRGYSGAINDGRALCHGETLIVSNPDVTFAPDSIDLLVEPLGERAAVTGPALYWDDAHEWLLPPSDLGTGLEKLSEIGAARSGWWNARRDRRRILRRIAFWSLARPQSVRAISGAVMAIRAKDFDAVDGFDERFHLYFEENDFLRRLLAIGKRIVYVPAARCRHVYNQSAGQDSAAAGAIYAESERVYLAKWNGPFVAMLNERFARPATVVPATLLDGPLELNREDVVVEASPLATFATAAGHFPRSRRVVLPAEVLASFRGSAIYLRVIEKASGRVTGTYATAAGG